MKIIGKFLKFIALMMFLILALVPLYWVIVTSLKNSKEIYTFPLKYLPKIVSFESYRQLFTFSNFAIYFKNSLTVALIASFGALLISMFSGYALSRYSFKFRKYILLSLFFTQMIPLFMVMVPLYDMFSKVRMLDKLITLMILYTNMMIPFSTIMAKAFLIEYPLVLKKQQK